VGAPTGYPVRVVGKVTVMPTEDRPVRLTRRQRQPGRLIRCPVRPLTTPREGTGFTKDACSLLTDGVGLSQALGREATALPSSDDTMCGSTSGGEPSLEATYLTYQVPRSPGTSSATSSEPSPISRCRGSTSAMASC
jgi:hypothetical protein